MRVRDSLVNPLLALTALLVLLLALETGCRVRAHLLNRGLLSEQIDPPIDPPADGPAELGHLIRLSPNRRLIYELKPNLAVEYKGARMTTNRWGFRGPDHPQRKEEGVSRIVGIGDSFMFGFGVADDETYLALLEARLNRTAAGREPRRGGPGPEWQVINTAVPGYNTAMEVETLKEKGLRFSPDLVIIEFVGNDLALPNFIRVREPVLSIRKSFLVDYFAKRSEASLRIPFHERLAAFGVVEAPAGKLAGEYRDDPERVPPEYRDLVGWAGCAAALKELRRLATERGFTVVWLTLAPGGSPQNVRRLARRLGFHVLEVGKSFRRYLAAEGLGDYLGSPLARSATDGHPSALGHRLAAETIYEYLERQRLLARPAAR